LSGSVLEMLDAAAPASAIALMVVGTTTPLPAELTALAVAMNHGFWPALGLIWSGAMLGALISYATAGSLARHVGWLGRNRAVLQAKDRLNDLGWIGILGLRLIPLVPFSALSLAAGLLKVRPAAYFAGTALGILPASLVMALVGRGLISEDRWTFLVALFTLAGALVIMLLLRRSLRRRPRLPFTGASPIEASARSQDPAK
jgi:uncharacterized membrane protein YdjX (TVP38/TMEM64 family)